MSYLVLARKFRPTTFSEVVGQEHISQTLKNAIAENKVAHAYLFSGPRGTGKTTMARIFAKALNCLERTSAEPCGHCKNCLEISKNQSLDVFEIDGASNNRIDEIRELRYNVKFGAMSSKYKIYIIDEVHQITKQAFDALLKTLEEPPEHVVFILATTELHKVPITILSRCQKYRFRLLSSKEISEAILNIAQKENFTIEPAALEIIVNASGGSMRDALSLLDQALSSSTGQITTEYMRNLLGLLPKEIIAKTVEDIANCNESSLLKTCKQVYEQGYNILQFAKDLRDYVRQLMVYSISPDIIDIATTDKKLYDKQKTLFTSAKFVRMGNLLSKVLELMKNYDQPRILLEIYLLKMAQPYYSVKELLSQIKTLSENMPKTEHLQTFTPHSSSESLSFEHEQTEHVEVMAMADSVDYDILTLCKQAIAEIARKHPMIATSINKGEIKVVDANTLQISFANKYSFDMSKDYNEEIRRLVSRKLGREITINIILKEDDAQTLVGEVIHEEIQQHDDIQEEKFVVSEDLKETAKTAIPTRIENIAKKFSARAVKKEPKQKSLDSVEDKDE